MKSYNSAACESLLSHPFSLEGQQLAVFVYVCAHNMRNISSSVEDNIDVEEPNGALMTFNCKCLNAETDNHKLQTVECRH